MPQMVSLPLTIFYFSYCFFFVFIVYYRCHSYDDLYTGKISCAFFVITLAIKMEVSMATTH